MPGVRQPTGATRFALELDGAGAGLPASAAGGDAVGDVVVAPGPDGIQRKHIGAVRFTDIVLTCGIAMEKPFWSWLADTVSGKSAARNGALRILDFDRKERERLTFTNALVTEISFPALDGSSKEAFQFTVRIAPEFVRRERGDGTSVIGNVKSKQALVSNFEVTLGDLDLSRVAGVGPLTVRRPLAEDAVGAVRDVQLTPGPLEIGDLELTLSEAGSESIVDWHRTFVIDGKSSDAEEKSGSIALLDPARSDALLKLDLTGVGIFALERTAAAGGTDAISRLTARMYCEELRVIPPVKLA